MPKDEWAKVSTYYSTGATLTSLLAAAGKIDGWAACKDDAAYRSSFWQAKQAFLQYLPPEELVRLDELSSAPRDDSKGEVPGSERGDEEERLFLESLSDEERQYLEEQKGLGTSQKAEVAWLDRHGYLYEELDVREFTRLFA